MHLSLVIPAHNEAQRIERTLRAYATAFRDEAELLVVVNGSKDATAELARRVAAEHRCIRVIEILEPVGKGGAVKAGLAEAVGTWVGFVDADLATSPEEYRRMLVLAERGDGAVGSRWAPGARVIGRSALRTVASRGFATVVRGLFGLPFTDTQCGAKIFHRRFLPGYLATSRLQGMAFDVEMLLLLRRAGARIADVPTVWMDQPGSSTLSSPLGLLKHGLLMLGSLARLKWGPRGRALE